MWDCDTRVAGLSIYLPIPTTAASFFSATPPHERRTLGSRRDGGSGALLHLSPPLLFPWPRCPMWGWAARRWRRAAASQWPQLTARLGRDGGERWRGFLLSLSAPTRSPTSSSRSSWRRVGGRRQQHPQLQGGARKWRRAVAGRQRRGLPALFPTHPLVDVENTCWPERFALL